MLDFASGGSYGRGVKRPAFLLFLALACTLAPACRREKVPTTQAYPQASENDLEAHGMIGTARSLHRLEPMLRDEIARYEARYNQQISRLREMTGPVGRVEAARMEAEDTRRTIDEKRAELKKNLDETEELLRQAKEILGRKFPADPFKGD